MKNRKNIIKYFRVNLFVFFVAILASNFQALASTSGLGTGIETTVKDNEFSRAAAQLRQKSAELDQRQQSLAALEQQIAQGNRRRDQVLVLAGLGLFSLIGLNYYLDFHRRKQGAIKT